MTLLGRAAAGFVLAALIALLARRARQLSASGAAAAIVIGTCATAAGWSWAILLIAFFVLSSALSHVGSARKRERTSGVVEKGGARDAAQVAVNGGIFGLSALLSLAAPWAGWSAIAAGSLGAAMADTWSTEIGTLVGGTPHLITTGRVVPAGTSGAITLPGSLGAVAGAAVLALVARAVGWSSKIALAAFVAGIAGALADTLIGALIQSRRWCDACSSATEQRVHHCGTATRHHGGLAWLDNDGVNLACAAVGGVVAWMIHA